MDTQRDKFKFDTVEKVKDFLAYASEIGRGEMHMHQMHGKVQETIKRQCEGLKEASHLFVKMKPKTLQKYMTDVCDAAKRHHANSLHRELYLTESGIDELHFSVDEHWDEFFSAFPFQSLSLKVDEGADRVAIFRSIYRIGLNHLDDTVETSREKRKRMQAEQTSSQQQKREKGEKAVKLGLEGKTRKLKQTVAHLNDSDEEGVMAAPVRGGSNRAAVQRPNVPHTPSYSSSSSSSSSSSQAQKLQSSLESGLSLLQSMNAQRSPQPSITERLMSLANMLQDGVITREEHDENRKRVLGSV